MATTWRPADLSQTCAVYTTVTTCAPSSLIFLQLIASLFGNPQDGSGSQGSFSFGNHEFPGSAFGQPGGGWHGLQGLHYGEFFGNAPGVGTASDSNQEEFDFIVVGAGSAGCVVANRLSEIHQWRVLLLEAGTEEPDVTLPPSFSPLLLRSSIDWTYMTQPSSTSCLARPQGQCHWARGKVMGGSSAINYLIYIRGTPEDYDGWAAMGNPGWSYREVLPYFIKSEDNRNPDRVDPPYHGQGGYQSVSLYPYQDKNVFAIINSFKELGLPELDQNSEHVIGVSLLQSTSREGARVSTNRGFIKPVRSKRRNLVIRTQAEATQILIDQKTKIAFGVQYTVKGRTRIAIAKKEVISSAGAINSPKLLMLSGIGPAQHLSSLSIQVVKDLPVGANLHDHCTMDGVVFALTNKTATTVSDERRNADVHYYRQSSRGPLSAPGPLQVNAMVQTKYEQSHNLPDIQYSFDAASVQNFFTDPILTAQTTVNPLAYYDGLMVRPVLLNPESRGYILLNNSDPVFGPPLIYANTFAERIDLSRVVEGVKQSLNLLRTPSMAKIHARLVTTPLPACYPYQFGTDEYWECVASSYTATIFHPVGTCKMGPEHDRTTVVDHTLQVHGVKNLRVIDASIMPKIPRGNTNAPTIMIAEKGSDLIKERWLEGGSDGDGDLSYDIYEPGFQSNWHFKK